MKDNKANPADGIGLTLLLVAFVVLKLCHVIEWSWWWVLSPMWAPLAIALLVVAGCYIWAGITNKR